VPCKAEPVSLDTVSIELVFLDETETRTAETLPMADRAGTHRERSAVGGGPPAMWWRVESGRRQTLWRPVRIRSSHAEASRAVEVVFVPDGFLASWTTATATGCHR
jgi:hypothetical protein